MRVLVIDSDPAVSAMLGSDGCNVTSDTDLDEVAALLKYYDYDLIVAATEARTLGWLRAACEPVTAPRCRS
jgi:hypothetical protein